jgi:hypothetical protein
MSGPKFTPGPWSYERADKCSDYQFQVIGTEDIDGYASSGHVIAGVFLTAYGDIPIRDGKANARLIAAAPEMFALLDKVFADNLVRDWIGDEWSALRSRILDGSPS